MHKQKLVNSWCKIFLIFEINFSMGNDLIFCKFLFLINDEIFALNSNIISILFYFDWSDGQGILDIRLINFIKKVLRFKI